MQGRIPHDEATERQVNQTLATKSGADLSRQRRFGLFDDRLKCGGLADGNQGQQPGPLGQQRDLDHRPAWLADRFGRRNLLALNIVLFSLSMPLVAISSSFWMFVALCARVRSRQHSC